MNILYQIAHYDEELGYQSRLIQFGTNITFISTRKHDTNG